jgi:hypothetical protein
MKERQRRQETSDFFPNDLATLLEEAKIAMLAICHYHLSMMANNGEREPPREINCSALHAYARLQCGS